MSGDVPDPVVRKAVLDLLRASEEYTRAYGAWSVDPHRWNELRAAEQHLEEARRHAVQVQPVTFEPIDADDSE